MAKIISARCQAFLDHWNSLRQGDEMPTLQGFLARPNPDVQSNVLIIDFVSREEIPIRLFGTALVDLLRSDLTHKNCANVFAPPGASGMLTQMAEILVGHPCGATNINLAVTANGHAAEWDSITLPLTPKSGSPPCLVGFFECITDLEPDDFIYQMVGYGETAWIDIGSGTPNQDVAANTAKDSINVGTGADRFKTFIKHWHLLKGDALAPKLSDFLSRPIPILQPNVTILDLVSPEMLKFRLIGTSIAETFGMDATGQNILDFMPSEDGKTMSDIAYQIVAYSCGVEIVADVVTNTGRSMTSGSAGFPLRRKEGEADCVVWLNWLGEANYYGEPLVSMSGFKRVAWIDAGAGVPE